MPRPVTLRRSVPDLAVSIFTWAPDGIPRVPTLFRRLSDLNIENSTEFQRQERLEDAIRGHLAGKAFSAFRARSIEAVLIKGPAIGRFYPANKVRHYTDIDLCVAPDDFNSALDLVRSDLLKDISIDLHCGLRDRDTLPWEELFLRTYETDLPGGSTARVLCDEDNLRITCAHWLFDGGVDRSRLWDIFYLVSNRRSDFDWERCLKAGGEKRENWVKTAIATARDKLGLDTSDLPEEIDNFVLPSWYIQTLEKEWSLGGYVRVPLYLCLTDPKLLRMQLKRRFPPNPIAATTDVEGVFDNSPRMSYQAMSIRKKLGPSFRGVFTSLALHFKSRS